MGGTDRDSHGARMQCTPEMLHTATTNHAISTGLYMPLVHPKQVDHGAQLLASISSALCWRVHLCSL